MDTKQQSAYDDLYMLGRRYGEADELRELFGFYPLETKKICAAIDIGERMMCGKPCEGFFCDEHHRLMQKNRMIPGPCLGCGIGVMRHERLCTKCEKKADKPERNENRGPSRAKFDMLTFDDEFCFGLRD